MEVLSPLEHSVLQWDKSCDEQSVDNYNPSMTMNGSSQDNGEGYINDQTFHTPSFGDEEFDIPPISFPPTSNSDSVSNDIYGTTQPLSHHHSPDDLQDATNQQHMLPPSPPLSQHSPPAPASCSQAIGQSMMTTVTSSPPMTPYGDSGQQVQQYSGQAPTNTMPQHPQQQQQQQHDMYMLQMMPPQAVHFQVQPYGISTSYATGPSQLLHQQHAPHHQVPPHHPGLHPHHQLQHHHMPQHQQQMMGHHSPMLALHLGGGGPRPQQRPASVGSSPPGSNHTSPGLETSEDSDDSGHLTQLMAGIKRPSPEPVERPPSGGKPIKKPKTQKKKKKRDPNEPQKPVSAYALFFRDTQAAIKGQNPNASFGEVSKIVASMWDGLEVDHKNVYKRKTEAAKKEYLKALAAYRSSLVSKAANDQSDNIYGGGNPGPSTPSTSSSPMAANGGGPSPLQKKSPLLTSLMEGTSPITNLHNMTQPQPLLLGQGTMGGMPPPHMLQPHMQHNSSPPQMLHQMLSSPSGQMNGHMVGHHQMNSHPGQQNNGLMNNNNMAYSPGMIGSPIPMQHCSNGSNGGQGPGISQGGMMCSPPPPPLQNCLRNPQEQQQSPEWSNRDYCNTDCVVSHCRDVFTTWVASRPPPPNSYASVK